MDELARYAPAMCVAGLGGAITFVAAIMSVGSLRKRPTGWLVGIAAAVLGAWGTYDFLIDKLFPGLRPSSEVSSARLSDVEQQVRDIINCQYGDSAASAKCLGYSWDMDGFRKALASNHATHIALFSEPNFYTTNCADIIETIVQRDNTAPISRALLASLFTTGKANPCQLAHGLGASVSIDMYLEDVTIYAPETTRRARAERALSIMMSFGIDLNAGAERIVAGYEANRAAILAERNACLKLPLSDATDTQWDYVRVLDMLASQQPKFAYYDRTEMRSQCGDDDLSICAVQFRYDAGRAYQSRLSASDQRFLNGRQVACNGMDGMSLSSEELYGVGPCATEYRTRFRARRRSGQCEEQFAPNLAELDGRQRSIYATLARVKPITHR